MSSKLESGGEFAGLYKKDEFSWGKGGGVYPLLTDIFWLKDGDNAIVEKVLNIRVR